MSTRRKGRSERKVPTFVFDGEKKTIVLGPTVGLETPFHNRGMEGKVRQVRDDEEQWSEDCPFIPM
jgi:hypothetical protein